MKFGPNGVDINPKDIPVKRRNPKTRGNYPIPFCIRGVKCKNHDKSCDECLKFSEYVEKV